MYPLAGAILIWARPKWIVPACSLAGVVAGARFRAFAANVLILYACESLSGQPIFYVMERMGENPGGMIVPLIEQDFADHPGARRGHPG